MPKLPIALQMYTLRDDADKDFAGTIRKVAEIGYAAVELAGRGSLSVQELSGLLADNHLKVAGSHIGLDALESDLSKVIEENLALETATSWSPTWPKSADARRMITRNWRVLSMSSAKPCRAAA